MHPNAFLKAFWRLEVRNEVFVAMSFDKRYDERFANVITPAIESLDVGGVKLRHFHFFRHIQGGILTQGTQQDDAVHTGFELKLQVLRHRIEIQAAIFGELGGDGRKYSAPFDCAHTCTCFDLH